MALRQTKRGAQRTSLDGTRVDVLICGASFAGLATARKLAGSGASVLMIDRYEIGERATSACAVPTPWIGEMRVEASVRQEIPCMSFATPHGSWKYRLPWSWSSFDYRDLCLELWKQCDGVDFETAKVEHRRGREVVTDRGSITADILVDALGWRRVLGHEGFQPPEAPLSRGLEVHPHDSRGEDLEIWIDRSLAMRGYGWSVPADGERRIGVGSYRSRDHVRRQVGDLAQRLDCEPERFQGNWFPHRLRPATEDGVFFVGDSAGHCIPLSGEGIRPAFYFGTAAGREIARCLDGRQTASQALDAYGRFSAKHARFFSLTLGLQRILPALPPRVLSAFLKAMANQRLVDRAFGWYLRQADVLPEESPTPDLRQVHAAA